MFGGRDSEIYRCLDRKNPIDNTIIQLKKEGILDIGVVKIRCGS